MKEIEKNEESDNEKCLSLQSLQTFEQIIIILFSYVHYFFLCYINRY